MGFSVTKKRKLSEYYILWQLPCDGFLPIRYYLQTFLKRIDAHNKMRIIASLVWICAGVSSGMLGVVFFADINGLPPVDFTHNKTIMAITGFEI